MVITKVSIRHTLQAIVGLTLVILPVTIEVLKNWPRWSDAVQVLGAVTVLLTDPRAVFFVKTILAALISATVVCEALFAPFVIATFYGTFFENSE